MDARFRPDVMLLAAGFGTRLRPLTDTCPKPLVPVAGKPLIDRVVDAALAEGFARFVANAHHHADQLVAHLDLLAARHPSARFAPSREDGQVLGTGGGVKAALPLLDTDPVIVMHTDSFWLPGQVRPLARLVDRFDAGGAEMVLLCVHPRDATGFRLSHDFCLHPSGRITRDSGAPVIFAGASIVGRALLEAVPDQQFSMARLYEETGARGTLHGVVLDAPWFHVGDPEALADAEARLAVMP